MFKVIKNCENIKLHIDKVCYMKQSQKLIVSGWGFSDCKLNVASLTKGIEIDKINFIDRLDVQQHFQLKESKVGFDLELKVPNTRRNISLEFSDSKDKAIISIRLVEKRSIFKLKNLWDFYYFSKERGIVKAIKHSIDLIINGTSLLTNESLTINQQYELYLQKEMNENKNSKLDVNNFSYNPLISILVPVYNVPEKWLRLCLNSVVEQTYKNWELCIVDDASPSAHIQRILEEYSRQDNRIKYMRREKNGHISASSNDALNLANGEFIALLDNDDELIPDALAEVVNVLNQNKNLDMIYSDEDKITIDGDLIEPHFKPGWSPETFMSNNYICHFTVLRTKIVKEIGGFRVGYEGAQDYDLFLRFTEKTNRIHHISKVLYHWRMLETSTALNADSKNYAHDAGKLALEDALQRRGLRGEVVQYKNSYIVNYEPIGNPLVSIIIPTKDHANILNTCLHSIYELSTYSNFEIIIVNNSSREQETFDLFNYYCERKDNIKVIDIDSPFNYSMLNNEAKKHCNGDYIVLLNNDIEVITPNWIELMLGYAQLKHVGAVGAKLLYPDNTVQHCGVVLGMMGLAGHIYKGATLDDDGYFCRLKIPFNYGAVTAACLMVSKEKFELVDGLDENLAVAFNDIDFNLKLLDKNYYNVVLPQVMLYHHESKSRGHEDTPEKIERFKGEIDYMKNKWKTKVQQDSTYNQNFDLDSEYIKLKY